jgi:hypothetical protein
MSPDIHLTLEIAVQCLLLAYITALKQNLTKHQRELANGKDGIIVRVIEQLPTTTVEHKIEETSEKSGETCSEAETAKEIAIYLALIKSFFEALPKVR